MMQFFITLVIIVSIVALIFILYGVRVIQEYERCLVFRLGRYIGLKGPGLFWVIPILDKTVKVDLRTVTYDARMIRVITKDNVRCDIDSIVYYRVFDPKKAILEVENFRFATENIAKAVLRDVLGMADLDELLSHTVDFTLKIQQELDKKTDAWGVKVIEVAISDVLLPKDMQRAIAKQAEAEREKRSRVIIAEGEQLAAQKMQDAAEILAKSPFSLKLRELQTYAEIAREKNLIVVTSAINMEEISNAIALVEAKKSKDK